MNTCILCGRLTADPKSGTTTNGKTYCNFSLAVNKAYSNDKGADFIDVVAWGATAQNCARYLGKGSQILVRGALTTDIYERNGVKIKQVKVLAENVEFLSRSNGQSTQQDHDMPTGANPIEVDDDMPF